MKERIRMAVYDRAEGRCEIGGPDCNGRAEEIDHIVPRGMGGRKGQAKKANDDIANLRAVCRACHHHRHHGGGRVSV